MRLVNRARSPSPVAYVALETTLLVHGVPRADAPGLARDLAGTVRSAGAEPAFVGVVAGVPTVGLDEEELRTLMEVDAVPKANTANLGVLAHWGSHAATTVSATMELACAAGVRLFATGGLGGVHKGLACHLDVSADLAAFARFPVAVVCAGVKSILDVPATREALETLGVTVVGFRTDEFPAFYRRRWDEGSLRVDARFDEAGALARFLASELTRTGRGVVVANPIPEAEEVPRADWERWLERAEAEAEEAGAGGRDATPFMLSRLHEISGGATLRANIALVKHNAALAGALAAHLCSVWKCG